MSSDRSYVTLQVLAAHKEQAEELFDGDTSEEDYPIDGDLHVFTFSEVIRGDLDFLPALAEAGIPYDSTWDAGNGYSEGSDYCRFTPGGKQVVKRIWDTQLNPDMDTLLAVIDDPVALRQSILDHQDKVSVLSWDNQEEYSKIFQVTQLIST